jgi:hypothetical protein
MLWRPRNCARSFQSIFWLLPCLGGCDAFVLGVDEGCQDVQEGQVGCLADKCRGRCAGKMRTSSSGEMAV